MEDRGIPLRNTLKNKHIFFKYMSIKEYIIYINIVLYMFMCVYIIIVLSHTHIKQEMRLVSQGKTLQKV